MLVKGQIINKNNDNTFDVHIPVFDGASGASSFIVPAIVSNTAGISNSYTTGDVVFIGFENNSVNNAVILGKLFVDSLSETNRNLGAVDADTLNITGKATLPMSTYIGNISASDLANMQSAINLLTDAPNKIDNSYQPVKQNNIGTAERLIVSKWNNANVYRATIVKDDSFTLEQNTETKIATLGKIAYIVDMQHFQTYNNSWYSNYYRGDGNHTIVGMRVDIPTGDVYVQACNDHWTGACTFIIDYVLDDGTQNRL